MDLALHLHRMASRTYETTLRKHQADLYSNYIRRYLQMIATMESPVEHDRSPNLFETEVNTKPGRKRPILVGAKYSPVSVND
jgi:hypothetical protein